MRSGLDSRRPGKNLCLLYIHSAISRGQAYNSALSSKAPDVAFMRFDNIKLIDPPVVNLTQFKCAGSIACNSLRETSGGVVYLVKIVAKVHGV